MRNFILTVAVSAALLGLAACDRGAKGSLDVSQDMTEGSPTAPVTLIEYASVTCPHCAAWNATVYPAFKTKYIDTGKVKYVLREAPIHGAPDVAGFLVARCAGKDKYFSVVDGIMRSQPDMGGQLENIRDVLQKVAQSAGMSDQAFNTCVNDVKAQEALKARSNKEMEEFQVSGTPTFVLKGKKIAETGEEAALDKLSAQLDPLIAAAGAKKP
jgi:protein-disulfide isomerase